MEKFSVDSNQLVHEETDVFCPSCMKVVDVLMKYKEETFAPQESMLAYKNLLLDCSKENFAQVAQGAKCSGWDAQFAVGFAKIAVLVAGWVVQCWRHSAACTERMNQGINFPLQHLRLASEQACWPRHSAVFRLEMTGRDFCSVALVVVALLSEYWTP